MAHKVYYPAYDYYNEPIQGNFEVILNPLLDDLGRRVTIQQISNFLENIYSESLPYISSVVSDGVTISGTGTETDPLTVIIPGFVDTNFGNTDIDFTGDRNHSADGYSLNISNLNEFNIFAIGGFRLRNNTPIRFYDDNSSNFITLRAPSNVISNFTLTLPPNDGDINEVLATDGSGNLSWVTLPTGGGGGIESVTGNIVDNSDSANPIVDQIQVDWNATTGLASILNKPTIPNSTDDLSNDSNITGITLTNALDLIDVLLKDFNVSINYIDVQPFTLILAENFSIDTIDNPDALTVTITVNGSPYTLTNPILAYDEVVITVSGSGFINLNCTTL